MFISNLKIVSFLLACSIATVTVSFLTFIDEVSNTALLIAGTLSFSFSFILFFITLKFLVCKEINKIYIGLDRIKKKELGLSSKKIKPLFNPVRRINQEIRSYIYTKEKEIDELKKLEAYRREFIGNISHELKTPIFAAQGYVLTLLDGAIEDETVKYKFLKKAAKNLNGLDALVQDLLTISYIESGTISMDYEVFDLASLVKDVIDELEHKAEKKSIKLLLLGKYEQGLFVNADIGKIRQVFVNLIHNGIKYGRKKGLVEIEFDNGENKITIKIKDNGIGITEDNLSRIFERFYRVDKSRSRKQGGTGLGLAIVKHILESHETTIIAESKVEEGTTFTFELEKGE